MMHPLRKLLVALLLLPLVAKADTYVLKNGDKVEGTLVRETETSYILEVKLAPTIKDEREIPKDKVVRIITPDPGNAAFEQIRNLVPTPDGLRAHDYRQLIQMMTQFIDAHPANQNIRKAIEMRDDLRNEMRQVEEGSVKIDGVLYPANELRENAYELDARIKAKKIKGLASAGKHLQALRVYKEFQEEFNYTKVHMDMIPLMEQLIAVHTAKAAELRDTYNSRVLERDKGLERMDPAGRRASQLAIRQEADQLARLFRTESAAQVGWVTIHPFSRAALDNTIQYSKHELRKLDRLMTGSFTDCGALYRELIKLKQQGAEERTIREKVKLCQKLGVPSRYLEKFELAGGAR